ncbi:hypothetical protein IV494_06530 [Kaistella sp. G5-32]|uniref:Uncharacterized protein n=1 Tax=Kaistella gelatinilytica TaxID=2787636 RepID=A0ABS0FAU2_9FLAO|nr:hypothetical protein [Kaistella gelatinilytica]MBF8456837.1 hypothetical protein [Kaistella gelatinilytica]
MKYLKITYLIFSNFLLIYFTHKFFFHAKLSESLLDLLLSISCFNFGFLLLDYFRKFDRKNLCFLFSEWILGIILIYFLQILTSGKSEIIYWILIIIGSILGGILTVINFSKTFLIKISIKKYLLKLVIVSLTFPLIKIFYFSVVYQKTFYDLTFFAFIPEILIITTWQIFNLLELKKGCNKIGLAKVGFFRFA